MGGVKVATSCLHWSQPLVPHHSSPSSQTLASAISSPSSKKQRHEPLVCRFLHTKLYRSRSCELLTKSRGQTIRRNCSASLDAFSDEEFSKKIQELALRFQLSAENEAEAGVESEDDNHHNRQETEVGDNSFSSREEEEIETSYEASTSDFPASIERKANSVDLPVSLRMIKRKKQKWQEGFLEVGESAYCSVKKAFSSMVFIIRELHSYSLQMREVLFYEDLQGILTRVQKEIHASFVWLFQQVFSHTPTLMVYVMILLANFTVHSMATNPAIAAPAPVPTTESVSMSETQNHWNQKFDSSAISSFSVTNSKSTSIGGNNGGGGKIRPPAVSGTDGEGRFDRSSSASASSIVPEVSSVGTSSAESVSGQVTQEQDLSLWNMIVEEANRMQGALRDESIDSEILRKFVSPVNAKIEADDYTYYFRTELQYQTGLAQDPNNPLLLANYAQFLYLVVRDYDRAEEYFKRAIGVEPGDAEAYSKYASFLWLVKKDLWAAEETYLKAISADPANTYYAANYAHFLWSTGGEETCFPLSSPDSDITTPTSDF